MQIELRGRPIDQWHLGKLEGRAKFFVNDSVDPRPYKPVTSNMKAEDKPPKVYAGIRKYRDKNNSLDLDPTGESRRERAFVPETLRGRGGFQGEVGDWGGRKDGRTDIGEIWIEVQMSV